MQLYMQIWDYI